MLGQLSNQNQRELFQLHLSEFINMGHELVLLANKINWKGLESELSVYYSHVGQSSVPIRTIAGCLILK